MGYYITSEDDFSHTLIGGAAQNITLNSKITLEQYTRILFLNYPNSKDGALLAIAPGDKIITAFRNNGVWEEKSSQFIATKSDLTQQLYIADSQNGICEIRWPFASNPNNYYFLRSVPNEKRTYYGYNEGSGDHIYYYLSGTAL